MYTVSISKIHDLLHSIYAFRALTMLANSGLRDAPPTRNPSTSGWAAGREARQSLGSQMRERKKEGKLTKVIAVRCGHASTINNPGSLCDGGRNGLGEVCPDICLGILSLSGGGHSAGADRPNWFVRDDNFAFFCCYRKQVSTNAYIQLI